VRTDESTATDKKLQSVELISAGKLLEKDKASLQVKVQKEEAE